MTDVQAFVSESVVFPDETCAAVIQVKQGKIHHIQRHTTDVSAFSRAQVLPSGPEEYIFPVKLHALLLNDHTLIVFLPFIKYFYVLQP